MNKMNKYVKALVFVLLYAALPVIADMAILKYVKESDFVQKLSQNTASISLILFDVQSLLILFLIATFIRKVNIIKFSSFRKAPSRNMVVSVLLGLSMALFTYSLVNLDYITENFSQLGGTINWIISGNVFILFAIIAINSTFKEVCFRGLGFNEMRAAFPVSISILVPALLYGLIVFIQTSIISGTYALIGSLLFGVVFYLGKSIWASILTQFTCTYGMVLMRKAGADSIFNNTSATILIIVSVVAIVSLITVLAKMNKVIPNKAISTAKYAK